MKKLCFLCIMLLIIPFILTGCYDAVSLEKFNYAIAVAIDTSEKSTIKLSVQIASSDEGSELSSSQSTNNIIYSVDCETIDLGINILNNYLSKPINLSHCSAIIFSEDIAKKGVKDYINSLANNPEIRPDLHVLICSSKATDILENVSKSGEKFSSRYYEFVINAVETTGYAAQSEFRRFFYDINTLYQTPTANYITVSDNTAQSVGIAVFTQDKFEFALDSIESLSYLIVSNRLEESVITIPNPYDRESKIDISLKKGKSPTSNEIKIINGKPFINTKVYISGKITNMPSFAENDNINIIENELNKYLENLIEDYYYTIIKEHNSDLSNLSTKLASQFLTTKEFDSLDWNNIYKDSFYKVSVESKLTTNLYTKK